jgi:hypothetical protein
VILNTKHIPSVKTFSHIFILHDDWGKPPVAKYLHFFWIVEWFPLPEYELNILQISHESKYYLYSN